jgi:hypothetical protein
MTVNALACRGAIIDMREDVRLWEHLAKLFENLFSAPHANEPVMNDRYAHIRHLGRQSNRHSLRGLARINGVKPYSAMRDESLRVAAYMLSW